MTIEIYYYLSYDVPVRSESTLAHSPITIIIIIVKNRIIITEITIIES